MQARAVSFHTLKVPEGTPVVVDTNQEVVRVERLVIPGRFDPETQEESFDVPGHAITIATYSKERLVRVDGDLVIAGQE